mmetsp:Transcript_25511/g.73583  ORF Transcript_25511/g.73583 Transcript_25511/m.73583 type:complete len:275 (+) Transcript_25511:1714-2538(+)
MSTFADGFVVVSVNAAACDRDADLVLSSPQKAELVTVLKDAVSRLGRPEPLAISFADTLEFRSGKGGLLARGTECRTINFYEDTSLGSKARAAVLNADRARLRELRAHQPGGGGRRPRPHWLGRQGRQGVARRRARAHHICTHIWKALLPPHAPRTTLLATCRFTRQPRPASSSRSSSGAYTRSRPSRCQSRRTPSSTCSSGGRWSRSGTPHASPPRPRRLGRRARAPPASAPPRATAAPTGVALTAAGRASEVGCRRSGPPRPSSAEEGGSPC